MAMTMTGEVQLAGAARDGVGQAQRSRGAQGVSSRLRAVRARRPTTSSRRSRPPRSARSRPSSKARCSSADLDPPNGYKISGAGEGGVAGFAKGGATVILTEKDGGTLLTYNVEAQIGGKIAQLGQRLVVGAAKKVADDFFAKFAEAVSGSPPPECAGRLPLTIPMARARLVLVQISEIVAETSQFRPRTSPAPSATAKTKPFDRFRGGAPCPASR